MNFADVLQVQGLYQEKPALPFVPGGEVSGHVIEIGSSVKTLTIGAKVLRDKLNPLGLAMQVRWP